MRNVIGQNNIALTFNRVIKEIIGLGLLIFAVFLLVSIIGFHDSDPSLNMATERNTLNYAGKFGAYIAGPLLQSVGVASLFAVFMIAAWGWRLFASKKLPSLLGVRFVFFLISLVLTASLFAAVEAPSFWVIDSGLGGAIGKVIKHGVVKHLAGYAYFPFALILLSLSVPISLGLTLREWRGILSGFFKSIWLFIKFSIFMMPIRIKKNEDYDDYEEEPEAENRSWFKRIFSKKNDLEYSDSQEEDDDYEEELQEKPKKTRKSKKEIVIAPKAKSGKNGQSSLNLQVYKGKYEIPPLTLLAEASKKAKKHQLNEAALSQNARLLETVLSDFGVNGEIVKVRPGPVVTLYEFEPAAGTKSSRVIGLADDIARSMSALSTRIATIPGRNVIGIELPNQTRETVYFRELLEDDSFNDSQASLPIALGKDIGGAAIIVDLARMPHLLVAGTTGSGKSVAINTMITSLLYRLTPDQCKFIMIDPKMLELSVYDDIPHLLSPVVTEPGKAVVALKWTVKELENRYRL
ncbi:MAG: DNA translocase FtsK 4TM domain-containing protein, partial [Pseudomonadota bacterium]